jgi:hypothetical protein
MSGAVESGGGSVLPAMVWCPLFMGMVTSGARGRSPESEIGAATLPGGEGVLTLGVVYVCSVQPDVGLSETEKVGAQPLPKPS